MGNSVSTAVKPLEAPFKNCLQIERMIAAECDFLPANQSEDNIRVGVIGNSDPANPLSHQAIRFGDSDAYRLQSFTKGENTLIYKFEKNVNLTLMKRRDSILYNLKTPEFDVTREINPTIVRMYKSISMASDELDKIGELFQMK
jgi:hypothetical protein